MHILEIIYEHALLNVLVLRPGVAGRGDGCLPLLALFVSTVCLTPWAVLLSFIQEIITTERHEIVCVD
jgi:hypothetical protein